MKGGVNRCEEFKVSTTYHQVAPQNKPKEFDQMNYYIATLITLEAKMILTSCLEDWTLLEALVIDAKPS